MSDNLQQKLTDSAQLTKQKIHQDPAAAQKLAVTTQLQDDVIDIEAKLLNEIIVNLEQNKMSTQEARNLAKEFLSLLPIQDQKDLLKKLLKLSRDNNAAKGIYLDYAKPYEENETQRKLTLISQHLKQGNIDQALTIAKGGTPND